MAKLLVVDDEGDVCEFTKNFFGKRDIDVITASGGIEALKLVETEKPDLILLDIIMEDISGIEVLKRLRKNHNNVSVIMVSGVEDMETVNEVKSLGVKGFIHKPLALDELEIIVLKELNGI